MNNRVYDIFELLLDDDYEVNYNHIDYIGEHKTPETLLDYIDKLIIKVKGFEDTELDLRAIKAELIDLGAKRASEILNH